MNIEIRGVHHEVGEKEKDLINKKLGRLSFAEDGIVDLHFIIMKEKSGFKVESTVHFRWGHQFFLHADDHDVTKAIDLLFDKLEVAITKEKEKIKEHKGGVSPDKV
ncbi:MAG: ribosome-associated translation inhibitor RaiA [Spirochaetaceae bacterium]|nr:MAG: ribosome-associated translation inhibitor RaiA [Spirochaetaceae bacterium]